jgi:hypothetical protein
MIYAWVHGMGYMFKVKGQGHGEIDTSYMIISDIRTCGTDRNMFNTYVHGDSQQHCQGHGEF